MQPPAASRNPDSGPRHDFPRHCAARAFYRAASQIAWEEQRVLSLDMASKPLSVANANLITSSEAGLASRRRRPPRDTDRPAAEPSTVSASARSKKPKAGLRAALGALSSASISQPSRKTARADGFSAWHVYPTPSLRHVSLRRNAARCLDEQVLAYWRW